MCLGIRLPPLEAGLAGMFSLSSPNMSNTSSLLLAELYEFDEATSALCTECPPAVAFDALGRKPSSRILSGLGCIDSPDIPCLA